MKSIQIDLEDLSAARFKAMLERLDMGYPLKFKDMRPRAKEKSNTLVEFYLRTTPPARDILSGKAFRELFK